MKGTNSRILSYIYDFLSVVMEKKEIYENIKNVILFGSVSRRDYDNQSDIDLFFEITNPKQEKEIELFINESLKSFEIIHLKKWRLKKIDYSIKFIVGNLEDEKWNSLKQDIISNGIILYGKYENSPNNLKHNILIYFSTKKMKKKDFMKLHRSLFGYINIKNKKVYTHKGIIETKNILKLSNNVLIMSSQDFLELKKVFYKFKITYKIIEIWLNNKD